MKHTDTPHFGHGPFSLRETLSRRLARSPLWLSFMTITGIFLLVLTVVLTRSNYRWNRSRAINDCAANARQQLVLKSESLEDYFDKLADFCVLPVNEGNIYNSLLTEKPVSDSGLSDIKNAVSIYFYTRSDLNAYRIYLLNQNCSIGREIRDNRMLVSVFPEIRSSDLYREFLSAQHSGSALTPSCDGSFLTFTHSIIRISDRTPVALVSAEIDDKLLRSGMTGRCLTLYRDDGTFLYTLADGDTGKTLRSMVPSDFGTEGSVVSVSGRDFLYTSVCNEKYGFRLVLLTPMDSITDSLQQILRFSLLQGFLFLLLSLIVTYFIIRFLTAPLSRLSGIQESLGNGNFITINIGRSREASELSSSFNSMSRRIDRLVNENLVATLNEKTSQLIALEAQVNPHFLYNTLQAIGTEALKCDAFEIYDMLTVLARSFHYSIKAPNRVTLSQEAEFVRNYIRLQKMRMGERLCFTMELNYSMKNILIPKCCLQALVENSINHGMSGHRSSISISVEITKDGDCLTIAVRDDGAGISPEKLASIRKAFAEQSPGAVSQSIGLVNLYHRLKIMYGDSSDLTVESIENTGTSVFVFLKGLGSLQHEDYDQLSCGTDPAGQKARENICGTTELKGDADDSQNVDR